MFRSGTRPTAMTLLAVFALMTTAGAQSGSDGEAPLAPALLEAYEHTVADPARREAAVQAGAERAALCRYCHGADGNSVRPLIPKLAGQNPLYLITQFEKFADGRRKDSTMQELATVLGPADRVNLAFYYASLPVKPAQGDPALVSAGAETYARMCQQCHGADARGNDQLPRLAGQQPAYVAATLRHFRAADGTRTNPLMLAVTAGLSDTDIDALAAYLAGLE